VPSITENPLKEKKPRKPEVSKKKSSDISESETAAIFGRLATGFLCGLSSSSSELFFLETSGSRQRV
jgi:hypothetical protein